MSRGVSVAELLDQILNAPQTKAYAELDRDGRQGCEERREAGEVIESRPSGGTAQGAHDVPGPGCVAGATHRNGKSRQV